MVFILCLQVKIYWILIVTLFDDFTGCQSLWSLAGTTSRTALWRLGQGISHFLGLIFWWVSWTICHLGPAARSSHRSARRVSWPGDSSDPGAWPISVPAVSSCCRALCSSFCSLCISHHISSFLRQDISLKFCACHRSSSPSWLASSCTRWSFGCS